MTKKIIQVLGILMTSAVLSACVEPVTMLPPSDTYVNAEPEPRELTSAEKKFVDGINEQLQKIGMPPATVGGFEMNAASVLVNLGLAKVYRGSDRAFAEDKSDDVATLSPKNSEQAITGSVSVSVRNDPNGFLSDEGDIDLTRLHRDQHLSSRGLPFDFYSDVQVIPYEQRDLSTKDLAAAVRRAHFYPVYGKLRIGVAILVDGADNKRFYAVVVRDERLNVVKGAPRTITPGGTFELAGQIIDRGLTPFAVGVQGPSSITVNPVEVQADGSFHTTIKLPDERGLYVVSLGRTTGDDPVPYTVAVFAGVEPTPWPVYPLAKPPTDAYSLAQQLADSANALRKTYGLAPLTVPAVLSDFERREAESYAAALRAQRMGNPNALTDWTNGQAARAKAVGVDASRLDGRMVTLTSYQASNYPARFPTDAIAAYKLIRPNIVELGLGVAVIPRTADPSSPPFVVGWATERSAAK